MKTTVDIPDQELLDLMRFTNSKTKRAAIVCAVSEFNRRRRMAALTRYAGTFEDMISSEELSELRRQA